MTGFHRAVAEMIRSGNRVIIDEMLLDEKARDHWLEVLTPFQPLLVGVYCSLEELERRERGRATERCKRKRATELRKRQRESHHGLARWSAQRVHSGIEYDVIVDTTGSNSNSLECARSILDNVERGPERA